MYTKLTYHTAVPRLNHSSLLSVADPSPIIRTSVPQNKPQSLFQWRTPVSWITSHSPSLATVHCFQWRTLVPRFSSVPRINPSPMIRTSVPRKKPQSFFSADPSLTITPQSLCEEWRTPVSLFGLQSTETTFSFF